jgi:ceramide glucosyltransferase
MLPAKNSTFLPSASILKPVRGLDRDAYENFASYCVLDYPKYEIIFAVADLNDPVIAVIEKLKQDFPHQNIRLVTPVEQLGENSKVNSLCRLVREARYDLLVMTDSDVRVGVDYLRNVVAPFADPRVGAVTTFYRCAGGGTLAADLNMLGMCTDSVPGAVVARKLEGKVQFAFGWTMATTKKHLAEIGGWEAMANYHSDDFELGNRISRQGHRVELIREPVWVAFSEGNFREFFSHELRWSIGLRNVRPAGYAGMLLTLGLPWALLGSAVAYAAGWKLLAALYVVAYLILRLSVAWMAGVWGLGDKAMAVKLWLVPVRDAITAAIWVAGFFLDRIEWRGREYRVQHRLLMQVADRGQP